jgi:hypothetical protein
MKKKPAVKKAAKGGGKKKVSTTAGKRASKKGEPSKAAKAAKKQKAPPKRRPKAKGGKTPSAQKLATPLTVTIREGEPKRFRLVKASRFHIAKATSDSDLYVWNEYDGAVDSNTGEIVPEIVSAGGFFDDGDIILTSWDGTAAGDFTITDGDTTVTYEDPNPGDPDDDAGEVTAELGDCTDFEQYYTDEDEPVYQIGNCDSSIGIRG